MEFSQFSENADKIEKNIKISCIFVAKRVLLYHKIENIEKTGEGGRNERSVVG